MEVQSLQSLLVKTAAECPDASLLFYEPETNRSGTRVTYAELLQVARQYSSFLASLEEFEQRTPIVLYLNDQQDTLSCFWGALFADTVPVVLPQLSHIPEQRHQYIQVIDNLLDKPIWLTASDLLPQFGQSQKIKLITLNNLTSRCAIHPTLSRDLLYPQGYKGDAMFMLTSGSTGPPKAVRLNHKQVLSAVDGKLSMRELPPGKPFLNWIGFDHVASIVEIHLTAMKAQVDQIHVKAVDVISEPILFIDLLSYYQVSRTFAPNFFLAKLTQRLRDLPELQSRDLDLQYLSWLGSGGEANDVEICNYIADFIVSFGGRPDAIVPGFGMTETCAGSIYHLRCPAYDNARKTGFTSLGACTPGIEMRISKTDDHSNEGVLQVRGPVVFQGYYNNEVANAESFTADGWFITGDNAFIDPRGNLHLIGRAKELMNINGVKHSPQDIDNLMSQVLAGKVSRIVSFSYRPESSATEHICVVYTPAHDLYDRRLIVESHNEIVQIVMMHTGVRPDVVSLQDEKLLEVSSLGKISRKRLRRLMEEGSFSHHISVHENMVREHGNEVSIDDASDVELALMDDFETVLKVPAESINPETPIFQVGVNSMDIIRLKKQIDGRLDTNIPLTTLLQNPSARTIATALQDLHKPTEYNPVVTLSTKGTKTPLWLVHPGVGEVFVFLELSNTITDRPLYALRARGFDAQPRFTSTEEAVQTYTTAIKCHQPNGPYAIAGYSFGAMLAFEVSKRLESTYNDKVQFTGSFNLPPHIKDRMRDLNWCQCLLHLCYFLSLISPDQAEKLTLIVADASQSEALTTVIAHVDRARWQELNLTRAALADWVQLAHELQHNAVDYEPSGRVPGIDVFVAEPLRAVARNKTEWIEKRLSLWSDFSREPPRFHDVEGEHYTMLDPTHVRGFSETLTRALEARGL